MTEKPLDPDALADELDRVLSGQDSPTPLSDDPLIGVAVRLSHAPRPTLSPLMSARIRRAMLAAQPTPQVSTGSFLRRFRRQPVPTPLAFFAALLMLGAGMIFAASIGTRLLNPAPTPSSTFTTTSTAPDNNTLLPNSLLPTDPALPTAIPATASKPTLPVTLIIEGPIEAINDNSVIIFNISVLLSRDDPLLRVLQVGDVLRIEGSLSTDERLITAVRATLMNAEVNTNPVDGQVWRDPGDCSNPPPAWAPANGWRRRCQGASSLGNSGGEGIGMGE